MILACEYYVTWITQCDCNSERLSFLTGKGCVFTYDAVGSYERTGYSAQGTGAALMMPVLDNQLKSPSPLLLPARVSSISLIFHLLNRLMGRFISFAMVPIGANDRLMRSKETMYRLQCIIPTEQNF